MNDVLIFILDDDMDEAQEIGILLQENGFKNYKIFTLSTSMLENIDSNARIFIIDYKLDKFNGLQVIEKIKQIVPHCYFIMLSGMKSYSIIEQFDNNVMRGKYITKGEADTNSRIIKFIKEFIDDMKWMKAFYAKADEIYEDMETMRKLNKGDK